MTKIYAPQVGNSLWIPVPSFDNPHLGVVIGIKNYSEILMVHITSHRGWCTEDTEDILFPSHHPALSHRSYVRYSNPTLTSASEFNRWANNHRLGPSKDFSYALIQRFQCSLLHSDDVPIGIHRTAQEIIPCMKCSSGNLYVDCCGKSRKL